MRRDSYRLNDLSKALPARGSQDADPGNLPPGQGGAPHPFADFGPHLGIQSGWGRVLRLCTLSGRCSHKQYQSIFAVYILKNHKLI